MSNATSVRSLSARLQRDDGAVICPNGTEVWRTNVLATPPGGPCCYRLQLPQVGAPALLPQAERLFPPHGLDGI